MINIITKKLSPDTLFTVFICLVFGGAFFLDTSIHRVCLYVTLLLGMWSISKNNDWKEAFFIKDPLFITTIVFCLYAAASLLWSENMDGSKIWKGIKPAIFITLSLAIYSYHINKLPKLHTIIIEVFVLSALATAIILLIINVTPITDLAIRENYIWRLEGFGRAQNSNLAGILYACALLCLLFVKPCIFKILNNKAFKVLCIFVIGLALALTLSRGAFLGFIGAFTVACGVKIYSQSYIDKKALITTLTAITTVIILLVFAFPDILKYMIERGSTGRIEIWSIVLEQFKESPWFGRGVGTKFTYDIPHPSMTISVGHAHSLYFSSLLHLGVLGSIIFFTLLTMTWFRAIKYTVRTQDYTILLLISFGYVFGLADFGGYYKSLNNSWIVFWIPMAVLIADRKIKENQNQEEKSIKEYNT
ncbi:MAG: O-antigen ligase family protein [Alphaproteobacteria bacterium]